jgi:hypothetical protein
LPPDWRTSGHSPLYPASFLGLAKRAMSWIFRRDRVGGDPADAGHGHEQPHRGVLGTESSQLELEGVDPGRQVIDERQALHEVRLPG